MRCRRTAGSGGLAGLDPRTVGVGRKTARAVKRRSAMACLALGSGGKGRFLGEGSRAVFILLARLGRGRGGVGVGIGEQRRQERRVDPRPGKIRVLGPQRLQPDQGLHPLEGEFDPRSGRGQALPAQAVAREHLQRWPSLDRPAILRRSLVRLGPRQGGRQHQIAGPLDGGLRTPDSPKAGRCAAPAPGHAGLLQARAE